jgi:hypothetical protein
VQREFSFNFKYDIVSVTGQSKLIATVAKLHIANIIIFFFFTKRNGILVLSIHTIPLANKREPLGEQILQFMFLFQTKM